MRSCRVQTVLHSSLAMTVAQFANILTFPTTIVYNLHNEARERNKHHALEIAIQIVMNNYGHLDREYLEALGRKIEFQQQSQRRRHNRKTIELLADLRRLLKNPAK